MTEELPGEAPTEGARTPTKGYAVDRAPRAGQRRGLEGRDDGELR